MIIKGIIDEDVVNYKKISMTIEFPYCSFKCDKECGMQVCQNSRLASFPNLKIDAESLIKRYLANSISESIVMQGLEPFDSWSDLICFIHLLRKKYKCEDNVVIYTGYKEDEVKSKIKILQKYSNIIIKFGRYIPNQEPHKDEILGVNLASDNQYARKIS